MGRSHEIASNSPLFGSQSEGAHILDVNTVITRERDS